MFNRNQKSRKKAKPLNPSNTLENSQNRYQGPPIRLEDIYTPSALIPVDDGDLSSQELEFNIDPSFDFAEDSDWEAPIPVEENYQENSDAIASNEAESESDGVTPLIETAEPIYLPDEEVEEFPFISSEALEIEGETAIASPISSDESFVDLPTDDITEPSVTTDENVPDSTVNAELNVTQKTETESNPEEIDTLLANDPHDDFNAEQEIRRLAQSDGEFSENFITDDVINNGENPENQPISTHDIKITASELSQDSDGGENLENSPTVDNESIEDSETSTPPIELNNPVPQFDIGTFKVDNSGEVGIDFLFDGGGYKGELAIISLEGMEQFEPGSEAFIQEAASRALSNSEFGHIVISDRAEGARFNAPLGEANHNQGAYLGVKTFAMRPGDTFGVMLVPNGTVQQVFNNPAVGGALRPLFSMATANPLDTYNVGQIADVSGDGNTFVMEDLRIDQWTDRDYNDLVFQVRGATGTAPVMDEVVAAAKDWRGTDMGRALIEYAKAYITPEKVPFDIDSTLNQIITDLDQLLDEFDQQPEQPDADADTSNTKPDSTYGDGDFIVHETDDRKTNGEAESNTLDPSDIPDNSFADPTDTATDSTLTQDPEMIFEPGEETYNESDLGEESKISQKVIATSPDPEIPPIEPVAQLGEQETSEPEIPPIEPVAQLGEQETPEPEIPPINAVAKVGEIETSDPEVPPIEPVDKTPLVEPGTDAIAPSPEPDIPPIEPVDKTPLVKTGTDAIASSPEPDIPPIEPVTQVGEIETPEPEVPPIELVTIEPVTQVGEIETPNPEVPPIELVTQVGKIETPEPEVPPIEPVTQVGEIETPEPEVPPIEPVDKTPSVEPKNDVNTLPVEPAPVEPGKVVDITPVEDFQKDAIAPTLPTVNSDSEIIKSTISQPSSSVELLPTTDQTVGQPAPAQSLPDQAVVKVVDSQPVVTPEINISVNPVNEPGIKNVTVSESTTLGTADTRTDFARFTTSVSTGSNTAESGSMGNETSQILTFDSPEPNLSNDPGSIKENLISRLKNLGETLKTQNTETQIIPGQYINPQLIANLEKVTTKLQNSAPSTQLNQIAETFISQLENTVVRSSPPAIEPVVTAQYQFPKQDQPIIGIIDTGFAENNIDIDYTRITLGRDRISGDDNPLLTPGEGNEHGTHILGIIGASQNNGIGIDGINDQAPIWLGRAVGSGQWAETLVEFVDAAKESGQPNAVVNLSLDLTQINPDGSVTTRYEFTPMERAAIEYARQHNVLLVVAAGNDGGVMSALGQSSQEFDNIITVGAAERVNDQIAISQAFDRANYSSHGNGLDILAPGGTIDNPELSTVGDSVGTMAGTSVATAKVTGAASQVWAANPQLSYRQVIEIIKSTATDLKSPNWDGETGSGVLNIAAAVLLAKATTPEQYEVLPTLIPDTWSGAGQVIPTERAARIPYTLAPGDTLWGIAQKQLKDGSLWREIQKQDGSTFTEAEAMKLPVGTVVYLPGVFTPLPTPTPTPTPPGSLTGKKIALDPGHGNFPNGFDPGAVGNGTTEAVENMIQAQMIAQYLRQRGAEVTIIDDGSLSLEQIGQRSSGSDLFISLHLNAFYGKAQGHEVYSHPTAPSADNRLAQAINSELDAVFPDSEIPNRGVKTADFAVLRGAPTGVPAVLVESLFIDAPGMSRANVEKAAGAIARGIEQFLTGNVTPGSSNSSAPASPIATPGQQRQYIIKPGDTLSGIALRELGDANQWPKIQKANGTTFTQAEARLIQPGQTIYLPVSYQTGPGVPVTLLPASNPSPASQLQAGYVNSNVGGVALNMRTGAATTTSIIRTLPAGTNVSILRSLTGGSYSTPNGTRSNWYEVQVGNQRGYVAGYYLSTGTNQSPPPPAPPQAGYVNSNVGGVALNMRTGAATTTSIIRTLPAGTNVSILRSLTGGSYSTPNGTRSDWYEVQVGSQRGYVAGYYVSTGSNQAPPPPAPPQAGYVNSNVGGVALNMRTGAVTTASIIRTLPAGTNLSIVRSLTGGAYSTPNGTRSDWYEVQVGNQRGYVAGYYITKGTYSGGGNSGGPITTEAQFLKRLYGHGSGTITQRPSGRHRAIDSVNTGPSPYKIYALAGGTIRFLGSDQYGGLYVDVWNAQLGRTFRYLHLQSFAPDLKVGQSINAGNYLGIEGYTGYTIPAGPRGRHTHFSIVLNGVEQDPWPILNKIP